MCVLVISVLCSVCIGNKCAVQCVCCAVCVLVISVLCSVCIGNKCAVQCVYW